MMYDPVTDSFHEYESVKPSKIILPTMENIGYQPDITEIGIPTEDGNVIMNPTRPIQQQLISPEEIFTPPEQVSTDSSEQQEKIEQPTTQSTTNQSSSTSQSNYKPQTLEFNGKKLANNRLNDSQKSLSSQLIDKLSAKLGLTDYQVAGILGNAFVESGINSKSYIGNDVGKAAGGLFGWRGSLLKGLKDFAKSRGKSWTDLDTQIDFLVYDLTKNRSDIYNALKSSKNEVEAAKVFMKYEKFAGYDGKLSSARSWQKQNGWSDRKTMQWINNNHYDRISYAHEIYNNYKASKK